MSKQVEIFTDGSCLGNPGPGGYGVLLRYQQHERTLSEGFYHTTNNRMELMAAIIGLETLTRPCKIVLTTDSQYVRQGITQWIHNWKKRGWRKADKSPVSNVDLCNVSTRQLPAMILIGNGLKAMPGMMKMNVVMNWLEPPQTHQPKPMPGMSKIQINRAFGNILLHQQHYPVWALIASFLSGLALMAVSAYGQ